MCAYYDLYGHVGMPCSAWVNPYNMWAGLGRLVVIAS
jgi:hypothetical protein